MPGSAVVSSSGPKPLGGSCEAPPPPLCFANSPPPFVRRIIAIWRAALLSKHSPSDWQMLRGPPPLPPPRFDPCCLFHQRLIRHNEDQIRDASFRLLASQDRCSPVPPFFCGVSAQSGRKFLIRDQYQSRQIAAIYLSATGGAGANLSRRSSRFVDAGEI